LLDSKVKPVRALERGLDVLLELQRRRAASLHELHLALGLPKATLLRMLLTLSGRGLVWQRLADGAYLPHSPAAPGDVDLAQRIAEVASPHLAALSWIAAWPSVIAVPRLDHVEIIETNSPLLRLDSAILGPVGAKLSYIHTATGRAYLSACEPAERAAILARVRPCTGAAEGDALIDEIVEACRARGYSLRDPLHPWPDRDRQTVRNDGRRSMAVAVRVHARPVAAINITWPVRRMATEDVVSRHLGALQATARAIEQALSQAE
jgi:IclR family transcriptional regulator, mhp operon transcriptional activator